MAHPKFNATSSAANYFDRSVHELQRLMIERLLRPKSIAVFGGNWARNVIEQCQKAGYEGEIWPVHPSLDVVAGLRCFSSVDALPRAPDASFIGINRDLTIDVVRSLAARKAGGAVCFASGFDESLHEDSDAESKQHQLVEAAGTMPIIGPNCYGFINYLDSALLWPDQHGGVKVNRGVAILTQSSNIAINLTMQRRGLPIAYVLTAGNQAQLSIGQLAKAVIKDPRVTAIGLHIEGYGDIRAFESLVEHARELGKSIVVLKVGRSVESQTAMVSHTRSLAGDSAASDAFLRRLGVASVITLGAMLESLKLLHIHGPLSGRRLLSMSCSGGEAGLVGDAAASHELSCPALNDKQSLALRTALGPSVALANPLDYHTHIWNNLDAMTAMCRAMLRGNADIVVLVLDFPREDRCSYPSWLLALDAFKAAGHAWPGAMAVMASMPENMPERVASSLMNRGVIPLCGLDDAFAAIAACATRPAEIESDDVYVPIWLPSKSERGSAQVLSEHAAKSLLQKNGLDIPRSISLSAEESLEPKLDQHLIDLSFPLVLKSLGLTHKSENNGIQLGIQSLQELEQAFRRVDCKGGCLIEEQIDSTVVELLVSIVRDPVHGLMLTLGAGGVMTELFADVQHVLLPATIADIEWSLTQLRMYPVLKGYRGQAGVDISTLLNCIQTVQQFALELGDDLLEVEINPLLCTTNKCIVIDALISVNQSCCKSG